ncbi:histidine kinase [Archangium lansingense]|uniref:sensor histidine kinase n=1 Tax=Archangium lansingense TaxID=2995310 RepID=UPI003B7F9AF7
MRRPRPWHRLPWRLTAMIAGATVLAAVVLQVILLALLGYYLGRSDSFAVTIAEELRNVAGGLESALLADPPDHGAVERQLAALVSSETDTPSSPLHFELRVTGVRSGAVAVFTRDRAKAPTFAFEGGRVQASSALVPTPAEEELLARALAGTVDTARLSRRRPDGGIVVAVPVGSGPTSPKVALLVRIDPPIEAAGYLSAAVQLVASTGVVIALLAGLSALGVGALTSRWLMSRLAPLTAAADAWTHGALDVSSTVSGHDELAGLSHQLNRMAAELRMQVQSRQQLAALEERHRLARDLHDTVKQHLFATAMQLGAARALLPGEPVRAAHCVEQASSLVQQSQNELMATLHMLRPSFPDAPWAEQLRVLLEEWSRREGISVDAGGDVQELPLPTEVTQELMCIVSEALSNVARHSGARRVTLALRARGTRLCELAIEDNGRGLSGAVGAGMGLRSMRERAERLPGGSFTLSSGAHGGVRIQVLFEIRAEAGQQPQTLSPHGLWKQS